MPEGPSSKCHPGPPAPCPQNPLLPGSPSFSVINPVRKSSSVMIYPAGCPNTRLSSQIVGRLRLHHCCQILHDSLPDTQTDHLKQPARSLPNLLIQEKRLFPASSMPSEFTQRRLQCRLSCVPSFFQWPIVSSSLHDRRKTPCPKTLRYHNIYWLQGHTRSV